MAALKFSRRAIALMIAIVLAGVATIGLVSYVQGARTEVEQESAPVQVLLATDFIPAGTNADEAVSRGLIRADSVPQRLLAADAATSVDQIRGRVASVVILKGEQIILGRFVAPSQFAAVGGLEIPPTQQAITIDVAPVPGMVGFVERNSHISIIAQITDPGAEGARVQYLLQDVTVLAVGERAPSAPPPAPGATPQPGAAPPPQGPETQPIPGRVTVTLAVSASDAEKLVFATLQGQLWFTLLPPGQRPVDTPGRTSGNAFDP